MLIDRLRFKNIEIDENIPKFLKKKGKEKTL